MNIIPLDSGSYLVKANAYAIRVGPSLLHDHAALCALLAQRLPALPSELTAHNPASWRADLAQRLPTPPGVGLTDGRFSIR